MSNFNKPFDTRNIVETYDLLASTTHWLNKDGNTTAYAGMIVTVTSDTEEENNGVYYLQQLPSTNAENWTKVGTDSSSFDYDTVYEW